MSFKSSSGLACYPVYGDGSVIIDSLCIITPIEGVLCLFHVLLCSAKCPFSFVIIMTGKIELVALL